MQEREGGEGKFQNASLWAEWAAEEDSEANWYKRAKQAAGSACVVRV